MVTYPLQNVLDDISMTTKILGVNISGKKTIAVYGDMNGLIYERMQLETPADLPFLEGFDAICGMVDKLLKVCRAQGLSSPEVISLAVSGPVNLLKGVVLSPPDLPFWDEGQLKGRLSVRYNLPVFIEHRSSAAALAEHYFGAGMGVDDLVLVDLEPVVALGLILNGKVYHGTNDAAGEVGKMVITEEGPAGLGQAGSLTGFASGMGMAELASQRFPKHWAAPPDAYDLVHAVIEGDEDALEVVREAADHLGMALFWTIITLDPELIVIGHPGDVLGEALMTPLREAVLKQVNEDERQLPQITFSALGSKLDDVAALMAVINPVKMRESAYN